jgi:hypothetical protein
LSHRRTSSRSRTVTCMLSRAFQVTGPDGPGSLEVCGSPLG